MLAPFAPPARKPPPLTVRDAGLLAATAMELSAVPTLVEVMVMVAPAEMAVTPMVALFLAIAAARLVASSVVVAPISQNKPVFWAASAVRVMFPPTIFGLLICKLSPGFGAAVNDAVWLAEAAADDGGRLVLYTTKSGFVAVPQLAVLTSKENFAGYWFVPTVPVLPRNML